MSHPIYYVPAGDVLPIFFDTFDGGTGASITQSGLAVTDIEIYKDGSTTQRASDAGYTLLDTDGIDFDGITGIHGFSIDTGDNTDASFYTVGAWFTVVVSSVTVDAQTVNFIAAQFRIMEAETTAGRPLTQTAAISANAITATAINADAITAAKIADGAIDAATFAAGAITATVIATGAIDADAIADNAIDAGAIAADAITAAKIATGAITSAKFAAGAINAAAIADAAIDAATFAADVDAEFLSYIVDDATRIDASALNTAAVTTIPAILVDTGTTLDGKLDTIGTNVDAILVDTGTTLDGLITTVDTVVDAIKVQTDKLTFTVANVLDANIQRINDVAVTGDGSGTPFNV